jgi:GNAT superfamily N-acetyltransferase
MRCQQGNDESMPDIVPDYNVLCLENSALGGVVAIVELSVQPLDPLRNPPPIPLPMFFKEAYCDSKGLPPPNAWISNLLVDENARGKGYSKMLMAATEGLAKQWGCDSISLHVDSDSVAGKVPQKLYERLGYEPVVEANIEQRFDWMGPDILKTGLYMVEGVPLIFLRKQLVN